MDWRIFDRIVELFKNLEKAETGIVDSVDVMAMNSKSMTLGMVLLAICWCVRKEMKKEKREYAKEKEEEVGGEEGELDESDGKNDSVEDWDAVSPEVEYLDSMLMCLHCVALAQTLTEDQEDLPRVADLSQKIDSYVRETVSCMLLLIIII